ncbi:MAG: DUF1800 domain-containing protein [Armatimonadetes bacterium]|nr:DUF1800 domain-containing protein [Armatimonadota bacterium]
MFLGSVGGAAAADRALPRSDVRLLFLKRFTFGARARDVERIRVAGPRAWLEEQLHLERDAALEARLSDLSVPGMSSSTARGRSSRVVAAQMQAQKILRAVYGENQLHEVMVDFWMNHFNVNVDKEGVAPYLAEYEREVIRPHALGRFGDMLRAVARSGAMLVYLDNWMSFGPESPAARSALRAGNSPRTLNENYARELLELHTLGVDGGYTQKDVEEAARVLTGWTVPRIGERFEFDESRHDDESKTVLGLRFPAGGGAEEGERLLRYLATHPTTCEFIARKLCRRFVSDDPPRALVYRVASAFQGSGGDIPTALRELALSPEFARRSVWRAKVKSPLELAVSAVRAVDAEVRDPALLAAEIEGMGQALYKCAPPTGYPDTGQAWLSPGSFLKRVSFAADFADGLGRGVRVPLEPFLALKSADRVERVLVERLLDNEAAAATRHSLLGTLQGKVSATTVREALRLTLGSPEFQKR